jgi:uncharacterized membrane protein (UPF0127 family)
MGPMSRRSIAAALMAALFVSACYGDDTPPPTVRPTPAPSVTFARANLLLDTKEGSKLIDVEVAETREQHELGLMHREALPKDSGMVFVFFELTEGGFWMKNTLIPLSIAFFDVDGEILKILDMQPCAEEPCTIYDPGVEYMGALEVNQGAFERWGVEEGDFVRLNR